MRWLAKLEASGDRVKGAAELRWFWLEDRCGPRTARLLMLTRRSVAEFFDDNCPHLAGSVAYHVLLSLFPLVILLVSVFSLVTDDGTIRHALVHTVDTYVPLTSDGRGKLTTLLTQLENGSSALGLLGLFGLVLSAGGMMSAVRIALNLAWNVRSRRPFVRGKALDLLLVLGAGGLLGASVGLTVAVRLAARAGYASSGWLSFLGPLVDDAGWLVGAVIPLLLSFAVFAFLYCIIPAAPSRFRTVWPGALVGAVLFQGLKQGFADYVARFGHYHATYGSLGAMAAFAFFVYLSANALLFGAEVASEYPQLPELDGDRTPPRDEVALPRSAG